jgi:hypothetical protein
MMNWNGCDRRDSFLNEVNRADLMSWVPPEAGCQGAVHNGAAVAAGRGGWFRPANAPAAGRRLCRRP